MINKWPNIGWLMVMIEHYWPSVNHKYSTSNTHTQTDVNHNEPFSFIIPTICHHHGIKFLCWWLFILNICSWSMLTMVNNLQTMHQYWNAIRPEQSWKPFVQWPFDTGCFISWTRIVLGWARNELNKPLQIRYAHVGAKTSFSSWRIGIALLLVRSVASMALSVLARVDSCWRI